MTVPTGAEFVAALRDHQLLNADQLQELHGLAAKYADMKSLARELLQRGWLTPFQVNQIGKGKTAELVLDQYVLLEPIGQGGMGTVYRAVQRRMKRVVAVKLVRPEILRSTGARARFEREVETIARLSHPNVVTVHDTNETNGVRYLVMEYVEGADLARWVKEQGPLSVELACDYTRQAALGLHHAHEQGLVHRDVKPANLLLTRQGVVKVMDLGLAYLVEAANSGAPGLTETGAVLGTADYLAPEQARNAKGVDRRADLYSLGCTLYFLLSGQPPFSGETATEKLLKHQLEEAPPLEEMRRDLPPDLSALVCKLMAKLPEARFPTAAAVATALERFTTAAVPFADFASDQTVPMAPVALPSAPVQCETRNGEIGAKVIVGLPPPGAPRAAAITAAPLPSLAAPGPTAFPDESFPALRLPPQRRGFPLAMAAVVGTVVALLVSVPALVWLVWPKPAVAVTTGPTGSTKATGAVVVQPTKPRIDVEQALKFYGRGRDDFLAHRYDDAIRNFTRAIELNPESAEAFYERARTYNRNGDPDKALADFAEVVRLDPKNALASFARGTIWEGKGDKEQAKRDYSRAIQANPRYVPALINRGVIYAFEGKYELAIDDYSKVLDEDARNTIARRNRGIAYSHLNRFESALADLDRVIEFNPNNKEAYEVRAKVHKKLGNDEKALEDLEKAKTLAPEKPPSR